MVCPPESVSEFCRHYPSIAAHYSNEVTKAIKVNTRTMTKVELACLFHLVAQLDFFLLHVLEWRERDLILRHHSNDQSI